MENSSERVNRQKNLESSLLALLAEAAIKSESIESLLIVIDEFIETNRSAAYNSCVRSFRDFVNRYSNEDVLIRLERVAVALKKSHRGPDREMAQRLTWAFRNYHKI